MDLSRETELILLSEVVNNPGSWTPDGQTLVYYATNASGDRDIWMLPVGSEPEVFLATAFNERGPRLSPNGKWLAYISNQTGEDRISVQAFPEGGGPALPSRRARAPKRSGPAMGRSCSIGTATSCGSSR